MVLEALGTVGLVGKIVHFVHFTCSLLSRSLEVHRSPLGQTPEHINVSDIISRLKDLTPRFESRVETGEDTTDSISPEITDLAKSCQAVAGELLSAIDELQPQVAAGELDQWVSFRKALKSVWSKEVVARFQSRLESLRTKIMLCLVSCIGEREHLIKASINNLSTQRTKGSTQLLRDLGDLTGKFKVIENMIPDTPYDSLLQDLRHEFLGLSSAIYVIFKGYAVLKSLQFETTPVHHAILAEAHKQTYESIFLSHRLPSNDPRSAIRFQEWLDNDNGVFWVTGKTGAGKSTLMKFLEDHDTLGAALLKWTGSKPLSQASFYFCISGTEMQKSLQGLFQSLLHTILSACPNLLSTVCEHRLSLSPEAVHPWTMDELRGVFLRLKRLSVMNRNFYFHIDGLDEYGGNRDDMQDLLRAMAAAPNIKMCVSSQAISRFELGVGTQPFQKMDLHTLTREDIKRFTREKLREQTRKLGVPLPDILYEELTTAIIERAEGVFLWICLVIKSLCNGLSNGDNDAILYERVHTFPKELDECFAHILNSVDHVYRSRMTSMMLVTLYAKEPLKIIHYSFMEELGTDFAFKLEHRPFQEDELRYRCDQTLERLNSRYKGLLEPTIPAAPATYEDVVTFLHPTLRDLLLAPKMQTTLWDYAPPNFDVNSRIAALLIAEAKFVPHKLQSLTPKSFAPVLDFVRELDGNEDDLKLEITILDHINQYCQKNSEWYTRNDPGNFVAFIAAHLGRSGYVRTRVGHDTSQPELNRYLSHLMLCPLKANLSWSNALTWRGSYTDYCSFSRSRDFEVFSPPPLDLVEWILEAGANPNAVHGQQTIWEKVICHLLENSWLLQDETWKRSVRLLLDHGASVNDNANLWTQWLNNPLGGRFRFLDDQEIEKITMWMFQELFEHDLDPNLSSDDSTLWITALEAVSNKRNLPRRTQSALIRTFLQHGANLEDTFWLRNSGRSWVEEAISDFHPDQDSVNFRHYDPIPLFDILFSHRLDPNSMLHDCSIWEHLLATIEDCLHTPNSCIDGTEWHALMIMFLEHGANPHAERIEAIVLLSQNSSTEEGNPIFRQLLDVMHRKRAHVDSALRAPSLRNSTGSTRAPEDYSDSVMPGLLRSQKRRGDIRFTEEPDRTNSRNDVEEFSFRRDGESSQSSARKRRRSF